MTPLDTFLQDWRISQARRFLRNGDRVLDIGSADGAMFRKLGFLDPDCFGIDPTLERQEKGPGYTLIPGVFPRDMPDVGIFDAITLLAVVEHLPPDTLSALPTGCRRLLKPEGIVIITVPSPAVDHILAPLRKLGLVHGMSLEEHHGYEVATTRQLFGPPHFSLLHYHAFQFGLNHTFVFMANA